MSISYKDVIIRLLKCPTDNRTKEARNFWGRESATLAKLYSKYKNDDFWNKVSFKDSILKSDALPSFLLFFDKDNTYWKDLLDKKWKDFNWKPKKIKNYKLKKNVSEEIIFQKRKRFLRDFLP